MKTIVRSFVYLLVAGSIFISCNNEKKEHVESKDAMEQKEHAHDDETEVHDHGYEMAMATYQCPMKCEGDKTYEEEGACPKCKMDLKKIEVAENSESKEENPVN